MEENNLTGLCKKYGLPPMGYSNRLNKGDGTFDRGTGKIQLSESLRFVSEAELLRVALHEAGHYHTCSFVRDILPFRAAIGFFALLVFCVALPGVRTFLPSYIPLFGLVLALLIFDEGRMRSERNADQWAKAHWPHDMTARGERYF